MADDNQALTLVLAADMRRLEAQMNRALKVTETTMNAIQSKASAAERNLAAMFGKSKFGEGLAKDFDKLRGGAIDKASESLHGFGGVLGTIGPAGFAAAAGIAAVAIAAEKAVAAAEWAESLKRTSETLGISTTKLQEWDFAMSAMGIGADKGRESLESLQKVIGRVEDGLVRGKSGPQVKIFESILGADSAGAVQEKLRQLGDINAVMAKIQDYSRTLSANQRAGVAAALKIDPDVLTTLADAKDKIGDLIQSAHSFGVIADQDLVAKAAEAAEKLHTVSTVMDDEVKVSMAGLATPLANAALGFLHVAQRIGDVIDGARSSLDPLQAMLDKLRQIPGAGGILDGLGGKGVGEGFLKYAAGALGGPGAGTMLGPVLAYVKALAAVGAQQRQTREFLGQGIDAFHDAEHPEHGNGPTPGGGGGRHPADHSGATLAEAQVSLLEATVRATKDLGLAHEAHLKLIAAQYDLALAHANEQKNPVVRSVLTATAGKTRDADLTEESNRYAGARAVQARKLTDDIFKLYGDQIDAQTKAREAADKLADGQIRELDAQRDLLQAQETLATTNKTRKAIAEKLLANDQARAGITLQRQARDDGFDPTSAQGALDATGAAKGKGLDREFEGPLKKFATDATNADVGEQLQTNAVEAMQTLNSGLIEAITNGKSLKDVLDNALKQAAGNLLKAGLERGEGSLINGLGSAAGAAGGGTPAAAAAPGAGSFGSAIGSALNLFKLFGFAAGTGPGGAPGGLAIVGEHGPELASLQRGTQISPNSSLRSLLNSGPLKGGSRGNVVVTVTPSYDMRGNSSTAEVQAMLAASAQHTQSTTFDAVKRALPGMQAQYQSEQG